MLCNEVLDPLTHPPESMPPPGCMQATALKVGPLTMAFRHLTALVNVLSTVCSITGQKRSTVLLSEAN